MDIIQAPALVRASSLDRDPIKKDFRLFQQKMWMGLFNNPPSPIMYDMGWRLQHGPAKDIIMGFRGVAKSYSTVGYSLWSGYVDPDEIILILSGSDTGAKGNAVLAYQLVTGMDWLSHMKPRADQRRSSQAFDFGNSTQAAKNESFAAMSLFGQITGRRCTLGVPDDVETPNTSETPGDRARLRIRFAELDGAIVKPKKEGGRIKCLGTSQTEETLYKELVLEKGYGIRIWPVQYPIHTPGTDAESLKKDEWRKYGPLPATGPQIGTWLAPKIAKAVTDNPLLGGTPTEPTRFDEEEIYSRRLAYGSTEFARQFLMHMDAGASDAKPLRLRDCPVVDIQPPSANKPLRLPGELMWSPTEGNKLDIKVDSLTGDNVYLATGLDLWGPPEKTVLHVDPSGDGLDECAGSVTAEYLGRAFFLDQVAALEGSSRDTLLALANLAKKWGVHEIYIEKNYGGGMFGNLLRPVLMEVGHPCTVVDEAAGQQQKELRILDALEPLATSHRLILNRLVLEKDFEAGPHLDRIEESKRRFYRFTYQFTRIERKPKCLPHDDRLDALASACRGVTELFRRTLQQAAKETMEAQAQADAEALIETRRRLGLPLFGLAAAPGRIGTILKDLGGLAQSPLFKGRK